jgi:argininosuccinate synthase
LALSQRPIITQKNEKVVLAYSGGLDTSYCLKYLKKKKDTSPHCFNQYRV